MVVMVCLLVVEQHANACRAQAEFLCLCIKVGIISYFMGMQILKTSAIQDHCGNQKESKLNTKNSLTLDARNCNRWLHTMIMLRHTTLRQTPDRTGFPIPAT